MVELAKKIKERGHWRIRIRPNSFRNERVGKFSDLLPIVRKSSVELRGWAFPIIDPNKSITIDKDWIGDSLDWENHLELWRMYQSGQFIHLSGFWDDWRDQSTVAEVPKDWKPGRELGVSGVVFKFIEAFEFAARLSLTDAGDASMHVEVGAIGLNGRILYSDRPNRVPFARECRTSMDEWTSPCEVSRSRLASEAGDLALKAAMPLFQRFGWDPSLELLRQYREELVRG